MNNYLKPMEIRKYFYLAVTVVLLSVTPALSQDAPKPVAKLVGPNLIQNAGFEDGSAHWKVGKDTAEVVTSVSQGGNHSLYYKNTDPKRYTLFTQQLDVKPGRLLQFSVWVKREDVTGSGAGIFLQSADTHGKYISGTPFGGFPQTLKGTFGWTRISGEYLVPKNEGNTEVGVYLRKGSTGEAWFDDVDIQMGDPVNVTSFLKYPNYRGMVTNNNSIPWQTVIEVNAHPKWEYDINVVTSLVNSDGKTLSTQKDFIPGGTKSSAITFENPKNLSLGSYTLNQTIKSSNDQISLTRKFLINVVSKMPRVYIDAHGFTVVDGKRFFPLGAYTGPSGSGGDHTTNAGEADLMRMADAGLNTVLSYGYASSPIKDGAAFLKLAQENQMHVIYSVKDMYDGHANYPRKGVTGQEAAKQQIEMVKDSPALLAWYVNDEMGGEWLKKLQERYDQIWELDGEHPAYTVSDKPEVNDILYPVTDVIGMDPYPIGRKGNMGKLNVVTNWTVETTKAAQGSKGVWMVAQIFNWRHANVIHPDRTPTVNEMRNMSYQMLVNGAKGMMYYAYHWLFFDLDKDGKRIYSQEAFNERWPDVKKTTQEISSLTDVILHDQKIDLRRLITSDDQSQRQMHNGELYLTLPLIVQYQAWQYQDKLYVMVVNKSENKSESLQLQIPAGWHLSNNDVSGIQSQLQDGVLKLDLAPIASGTIVLEK